MLGGRPVVGIGRNAFGDYCKQTKTIVLPDSLKLIAEWAFGECSCIENLSIPKDVESIGENAFIGCTGLTAMQIPSKVKKIGKSAFSNCTRLSSVTLPDTLQYLGAGAFKNCKAFPTSFSIPTGLTKVEEETFSGTPLNIISISSNLNEVANNAFGENPSISEIHITDLSAWCRITFRPRQQYSTGTVYPLQYTSLYPFESLLSSRFKLYLNDSLLTDLTIPEDVTEISSGAFGGCSSITSVTIPSNVKKIGAGAFNRCNNLSSIAIEDGVEVIESGAFECSSGFKTITLPESLESLGSLSFACCDLEAINFPSKLTSIPSSAFYGCDFTSLEIPSNIKTIDSGAFAYCEKLESINLSEGLTSIGTGTFAYCKKLASVRLPEGFSGIKDKTFDQCLGLKSVYFPSTIYSITGSPFEGCPLTDVYFAGDAPALCDETVFKNVTTSHSVSLHASQTSAGWLTWKGLRVAYDGDEKTASSVSVTVTNVIVHYIVNSIQPELAIPPSRDTGFVNVVAEVKGGVMAIPATWSANFPNFIQKFGSDFTKALAMQTHKKGNGPTFVWEDYVAGTDPTDPDDVFTASLTIVDGKPVISWSPELTPEQTALRKYTTYGKAKLTDKDWAVVNTGDEDKFNFFKVTVEMLP